MEEHFANYQFWITLLSAIITLYVLLNKNILSPLRLMIIGPKIKVLETRVNDDFIDLILLNEEKKSIIITKVVLEIDQKLFYNEAAPSKLQLKPSSKIYFIIEKRDKYLTKSTQEIVKPNDATRLQISLKTGSCETRFLKYKLHFYSGKRKTASTNEIIDFLNESTVEHLSKICKLPKNKELVLSIDREKSRKTTRCKMIIEKVKSHK